MNNKSTGFGLLAILGACILLFSGSPRGGAMEGEGVPPAGIAFINLSKVFNAYEGLKKAESEISLFLDEGEVELKRGQKEMENLKNEIMVYSPESKEYRDGTNEIERKELALKQRQRELIVERDTRMAHALKEAYGVIERTVKNYRVKHGLSCVLSCQRGIESLNTNLPEDVLKWVSLVEVIAHDDRLDISDAVITIINGS